MEKPCEIPNASRVHSYGFLEGITMKYLLSVIVSFSFIASINSVQLFQGTELCVLVFEDSNRNGVKEDYELFIAGAQADLYDENSKKITYLLTDGVSESICRTVEAGIYRIVLDPPTGYMLTTPKEWNGSVTQNRTTAKFGVIPAPPPTQICILVYDDTDGNGTLDRGESLARGARVEIFDISNKRIGWFTTDGVSEPNCTYVETSNYRIHVEAPEGYRATTRLDWKLDVTQNSIANLEFGVQYINSQTTGTQSTNSQIPSKNTFTRERILPFLLFVFLVGGTFMLGYTFKSRLISTSNSLRKKWGIANIVLILFTFASFLSVGVFTDLNIEVRGIVANSAAVVIIICTVSEILVSIHDRFSANYSRFKKSWGIANLSILALTIIIAPILGFAGYIKDNTTFDLVVSIIIICVCFEIVWAIQNRK